jgi:uncharacterized spore protein YtfJ
MDPNDLLQQARDTLTVKRVFGEPYEHNGLTILPAAAVRGGGGGGVGQPGKSSDSPTGTGSGAGFGMNAKPAGVYVIDGTTARWQPAIDVNRIILGGQVVAIFALLVLRTFLRRHR